jgi:HlyD family secretion protein
MGATGLFSSSSSAADEPAKGAQPKPVLTVSTVQPHSSTLPIKLSANGNVAAWQEMSVGAEASGLRLLTLQANVGDVVRAGQVLATFAPEGVQADVAQARANLLEAQANAQDAAANAERARSLQNTGALSSQQINQYLTAELTAKARVDAAQATVAAQQLRLKHTQVLAPDGGTVSARSATVGAVLGSGTELFRMIRQGRLEWRAEVTSTELGRLATGTSVLVTAPDGAQAKGRVRMVSPTVDAATRNGLVYVDLTSPKANAFKPGMFSRGEFELGSSGALTLPQTSVVVRDGFSYVYRVGADTRVAQLKVQTGRVLGDQVEITRGVKADDKLVVSGGGFLSDGDLVKVVNAASALAKPTPTASK